jgi:hypothetical protein
LRSKISRAEREQIPGYRADLVKHPENKKLEQKLNRRMAEVQAWKNQVIQLEKKEPNG